MEYPLISEYRDAILSAEDNFNELSSLRPVLDSAGNPVMSSGNFAVVFKMRDERDGKLYAVKCFTKEQDRRNESYRKIADELESASSSYIIPLRYLEDELFVDSDQCDCEEFPVVLMDWVEGETLSAYIESHIDNKYDLDMLSYRFNRMAAWLLSQPFAHGDLKPDNILVRADGSLVLIDYDGMFVLSMKGEKSRECGSPDYRHPLRTDNDFNERIDDFSIAVIALSLKAIALKPELRNISTTDTLLFTEPDFRDSSTSAILKELQALTTDMEPSLLLGAFFIALAKNSLELLSFRTFITERPERPEIDVIEELDTKVTKEELAEGVEDEFGVIYSKDGKRLLKCSRALKLVNYNIKAVTKVVCNDAFSGFWLLQGVHIPSSVISIGDSAFEGCESLQSVNVPSSVISIGNSAFAGCRSLRGVNIPSSVISIGDSAFEDCSSLQGVNIPSSVISIGNYAFSRCSLLQSVHIPSSVTSIGNRAFEHCESLQSVHIPSSVTSIGLHAFLCCESLQSVHIPSSVTSIGECAFSGCESLQSVHIPLSVTSIGDFAFNWCRSLQSVTIPTSVTSIGIGAFADCESLQSVNIPTSVTSIGDGAFAGCESLQSVIIPSSVTSIGEKGFYGCNSLHSIIIHGFLKVDESNVFPAQCKVIYKQ